MSSDYSGSLTPADSESFDKTFSGTGIEAGPGWDASGMSSYDLPPDLALPPLEVPSLGSGHNELTLANWPYDGLGTEQATYTESMPPPPPPLTYSNDSSLWYRGTDNLHTASSSPVHGYATGLSTPYDSDVSSLGAFANFRDFPSYPSLEASPTAESRLSHAVSYMRATQGSKQPGIGSASSAQVNDAYAYTFPSAPERDPFPSSASHTDLDSSVPPEDGLPLLNREPTQPPASPIEYKFMREWTAPPSEMPSNDHREVQSAPPETVMSRRKGKRKAEDLDESGDATGPGPSTATPAGSRTIKEVKAERARVRRSGEKRSEDALREAVAEYLIAEQVKGHVSKQKLDAYAVEYIKHLRQANLAWETTQVHRENFLRDALRDFLPPKLEQSLDEFAVDLIKRQRREIDELREQLLDQRMLNQDPTDADSVRDTILRYRVG